jgi:hypothetical protein
MGFRWLLLCLRVKSYHGRLDKPQSPFAGMADLSARKPVRVLSPDEIDWMLAEHRLISRRIITKATGRISHQAIWQYGIFPRLIIVGALLCWGANAAKE